MVTVDCYERLLENVLEEKNRASAMVSKYTVAKHYVDT